jgi:hypothetical protein
MHDRAQRFFAQADAYFRCHLDGDQRRFFHDSFSQ